LIDAASASAPDSSSTYYKFSKYYDRFFGKAYESRIQATIQSLEIPPGSKVLELGVGTGISLAAYPSHCSVVGVDLSDAMLDHARDRVRENGWRHIDIRRMNATELEFGDHEFDYVMAFHLVSVVDDVQKLMCEMHRVCKTNGRLVIINHFRSRRWWIAPFMDCISPLTRHLGWRTTLRRDEVDHAIPLTVERSYKTSPFSLFTILIGRTNEPN
jgi:phosphatidylethanolamine/phosphatidyl-N-methylethanolamine N-methyltransferase